MGFRTTRNTTGSDQLSALLVGDGDGAVSRLTLELFRKRKPDDQPHHEDRQHAADVLRHHELPGEEDEDQNAELDPRLVGASRKASAGTRTVPF